MIFMMDWMNDSDVPSYHEVKDFLSQFDVDMSFEAYYFAVFEMDDPESSEQQEVLRNLLGDFTNRQWRDLWGALFEWVSQMNEYLEENDGIDPPSLEELRRFMENFDIDLSEDMYEFILFELG